MARTKLYRWSWDEDAGQMVEHGVTVTKTTKSLVWVIPSVSTRGKSTVRFGEHPENLEDAVDFEWAWTPASALALFIRTAIDDMEEAKRIAANKTAAFREAMRLACDG